MTDAIASSPLLSVVQAAETVGRRLRDGFVPRVHLRNTQQWARLHDGRLEEAGPVTPAEGMILDELVLLQADEAAGTPHVHRLWGRLRRHRHRGGHQVHSHAIGGPSQLA